MAAALVDLIDLGVARAQQAARSAAESWRLGLKAMPAALRLPSLQILVGQLKDSTSD